VLKLVPRHEDL